MKTGAPITQACVLFLDFDGVLHSVPGTTIGHGLNAHQRDQAFAHLARLETLLQEPQYEEVMICVSSSWKDVYPWEDILGFFSEDMQKRVIGRTPDLGRIHGFWRFAEINAWLEAHPLVTRWVAVDDAADAFPFGLEEQGHAVFTHPRLGLGDEETFSRLRQALDLQLEEAK